MHGSVFTVLNLFLKTSLVFALAGVFKDGEQLLDRCIISTYGWLEAVSKVAKLYFCSAALH